MDAALLSVLSSVVILSSASLQDVRHREVDDWHWWLLLLTSSCLLVASPCGGCFRTDVLLSVAASVSFYVAAVSEGRASLLAVAAGAALWLSAFTSGDLDGILTPCLLSCFFEAAVFLMYVGGVIRGGADVKCLLSLSVGYPTYGVAGAGLTGILLPPVAAILFESTLMTFVCCGTWLVWADRRRPMDLPMVRFSMDKADRSFVWLCEDVVGDEVVRREVPEEEKGDAIRRLRGKGRTDVLVNPMIPFIVPVTVAFVVVQMTGCPFFTPRSSHGTCSSRTCCR